MPYNILIVDDNADFREELADSMPEYRFTEAAGGRDALKILKAPNEIDLVVLDVIMPDIRGTNLLAELKAMLPDMPVIILTGFSDKDTAIEALKADADDYIEKPINVDKTKRIIERLLESKVATRNLNLDEVAGKIERIKRFIARNYDKKVTLNEASKLVYLSPKYLSRIFKEHTGRGFNDCVIEIKLAEAKKILKNTNHTIDQISYKLGYQNPESFTRIFKKNEGKTPTQYRLKAKPKKAKDAERIKKTAKVAKRAKKKTQRKIKKKRLNKKAKNKNKRYARKNKRQKKK